MKESRIKFEIDAEMPEWTHLIRFVALEDDQVHLGQLVDTSRDIGLDSVNGVEIKAYLITGDIFNGKVTKHIYTVKKVRQSDQRSEYRIVLTESSYCLPLAASNAATSAVSASTIWTMRTCAKRI